jgi:hypothetical protein
MSDIQTKSEWMELNYIDTRRETNYKFGPSWEKAIIVGITGRATYTIQREVGNKTRRNQDVTQKGEESRMRTK